LEDDDEPAPFQDHSAEIGNVQNQLNSTNRSLNAAKAEREPVEQTLTTQAAQLSALQTQLSSATAAYETETKLLSTLKDRMGSQTAEIQKAREELIRAESDLSAVRVEKAEIEGAFLRDKEDIRELHRKMAETGTEVAGLKLEIEKAKKEAKQQKGLLAIARKQLSTKDAEKTRVQKELEDAKDEVEEVTSERESVEMELQKDVPALQNGHDIRQSPFAQSPEIDPLTAALAEPLPASMPVSPDPASPSGTSVKSNNPFDRLTRSTSSASSPRSQPLSFADPAPSATPPAAAPATEDPFGFSQAFPEEPDTPLATEQDPDSAATEIGIATPRQEPATLSIPSAPVEEQTISPGSEFGSELFSTPPTTADGLSQSPPNRMSEVPSIDSQFPPLDHVPGSFPIPQERHDGETDLGGPLKELDIEESDSDSDEEPLSNLKHKLQASTDNTPSKAAPPNGTSILTTSFDDAFGSSTSGTESTDVETPRPSSTAPTDSLASSFTSQVSSTDAFGAPLNKASNPFPAVDTTPAPPIAGVNAFDEAMGKIPSNGVASPAPDISFDSAFEDNFDFASASTTAPSFPPPPSVGNGNAAPSPIFKPTGFQAIYSAQANNGIPSLPPVDEPKQLSFEDAFSAAPSAPKPASQSTLPVRKASDSPSAAISFDDAFGGVASSQALKLDNTFGSASSKASAASSAIRQGQPANNLKPFPTPQSPPLSPQGGPSSPRISSIRTSTPPPRSASPPTRLGSPGPRPSTSSSKEGHEKLKEPAPRHSRLSVSRSCSRLSAFPPFILLYH
jgi:epidermal growth factor receptor substrate 15